MGKSQQPDRSRQDVFVLATTAELLTSLNLDEVLSKALALLTSTVKAERGSFFVFDRNSDTAQRFITRRNLAPERTQTVIEQVLQEGLAGWVYRTRQAALIHDTLEDDRWVTFADDPSPVRSVLCAPFLNEDTVHGIITLEHSKPNHFTQDDQRLVTAVANQSSVALRNAQLFHQVETKERQLQAVLESAVDPILTITPGGVIRMANAAAMQMLDSGELAVVGKPLANASSNPFFAGVAASLAAGETRFELRDESSGTDYAVQISSWREGESNELGYVVVLNDITMLKDLDRMKSQMLQIASHDLKNPLGVILGYTDLMLADAEPDSLPYEYLSAIARVSDGMLDMVSTLLNIERIESTAEGHTDSVDLLALIEDIVEELGPFTEQRHQLVTRELPSAAPPIRGDSAQLREAFKNLLDNASKYTPDHGLIMVRARVDSKTERFHYSVTDTGHGIPKDRQRNIFQRFYRAKQPGTEEIPGTGLGLSLVKAVIERHGGEVWFESEFGKGSTFGFWLPLPQNNL
jgi:signal transduction histidine kinase